MQSRIRNGRTRKKTKSELVLANLELGAREMFCVFWRAATEMTESSMEIYTKGETRGSAMASVSSLGERTQRGAHARKDAQRSEYRRRSIQHMAQENRR